MFLRAAAAHCTRGRSVGGLRPTGTALAQFLPPLPPLGASPPLMRPLPPAAVDNDDDLPPYDPPPGYRRAAPALRSAAAHL